jgi:amino-acid N-acetyltransferase
LCFCVRRSDDTGSDDGQQGHAAEDEIRQPLERAAEFQALCQQPAQPDGSNNVHDTLEGGEGLCSGFCGQPGGSHVANPPRDAGTGKGGTRTVGGVTVNIRPARPVDVRAIRALVEPYAAERILLAKEWVGYYEAVQEFLVATDSADPGAPAVGCGALHVMWDDLAEVRTLAVHRDWRGRRVGHALLEGLVERARALGLRRVFCLTFEVGFFTAHGFREIDGTPVTPEVYAELLRSGDEGVAEFLDLDRVKPNTLGNTRMLLRL